MLAVLTRALAGLALLLPLGAGAQVAAVPQLEARVTDLTGTLTAEQTARLEQKLAAFEARKGSQIAVLLVPSTEPESIEQYGIRVAEQWQGGRKGVDDGALLLVAKEDRALRIEVGRGLEGALTDLISNRIVEDIVVPHFKRADYYGGIEAGVDAMIRVAEGEPLPPPSQQPRRGERGSGQGLESLFIIGFILVFVVGGILRAIFGKLPAAALIGGATGFIAWLIVASLAAAVVVALIAFAFTLFGGGMPRPGRGGFGRGGWGGGYRGGWGGGGGWSGGSGGWGGGGGTFGGGGASGRW